MIRLASLMYFAVSAVWSFLMCFALTSMLVVGELENYNKAAPWYGAFEILSVLGMYWIPIALFTGYSSDKALWQGIPLRRNWAALMGFGHCAYFGLLLAGVPLIGLFDTMLGHVLEKQNLGHLWAYCLFVPAIFLLMLGVGNVQAFRFAVKPPPPPRNSEA